MIAKNMAAVQRPFERRFEFAKEGSVSVSVAKITPRGASSVPHAL